MIVLWDTNQIKCCLPMVRDSCRAYHCYSALTLFISYPVTFQQAMISKTSQVPYCILTPVVKVTEINTHA